MICRIRTKEPEGSDSRRRGEWSPELIKEKEGEEEQSHSASHSSTQQLRLRIDCLNRAVTTRTSRERFDPFPDKVRSREFSSFYGHNDARTHPFSDFLPAGVSGIKYHFMSNVVM